MVSALAKGSHLGVGGMLRTPPTPKCDVSHGNSHRTQAMGGGQDNGVELAEWLCLHFDMLRTGESPAALFRLVPQTAIVAEG